MEIFQTWKRFESVPAGKYIFSKILGKKIPYTGSVHPQIKTWEEGFAQIEMEDRYKIRNHLNSVHAVALMNLCEFTSGLAFHSAMPPKSRAILVKFEIEFLKKARGLLTGESRCPVLSSNQDSNHEVIAEIKNTNGEVVCRGKALWKVSPAK